MTRRPQALTALQLEDRLVPAIIVQFDFRYDDTGFFTDNPERITTLRAAALDISNRFADTMTAIPFPTAGNTWNAVFDNPSSVLNIGDPEQVQLPNLLVPANTIVVFVGARDVNNNETHESSSRFVTGTPAWFDQVNGRGQANSYGSTATDFSPWGGSISYDIFTDWHFGLDAPGNPDEFDLYTATQRSLLRLMGFGMSEAYTALVTTGAFRGPKAIESFGGPVPLNGERTAWAEDTASNGQRTLLDQDLEDGERITPTPLDLAAMDDIGWTPVGSVPPPPPPPAAPTPPVAPAAPIPANTSIHVVGSGEGLTAQFTVNDAATFTQLAVFSPYASYGSGTGFTGGIRSATADLNQDGVQDIIVGPGPGIPTEIKVFSGTNFPVSPDTSLFASGYAFETSFTGGVFVAAGDINKDGFPDVVVSPDEGGGPRVRIVSGKDKTMIADFFGIDDPSFRGGARAAVGDLNGDGNVDLVVAAGFGGGPRVAAYDGASLRPGQTPRKLFDFFVFESTLRNGAFVAVGDVNGDKYADLVAGGGPGGAPRVYILSGKELTQTTSSVVALGNFFAGDPNSRGGVPVAVKNIDNDRRADVVAGAGEGTQSVVNTYLGSQITPAGTPTAFQSYLVFESSFLGGAFVG